MVIKAVAAETCGLPSFFQPSPCYRIRFMPGSSPTARQYSFCFHRINAATWDWRLPLPPVYCWSAPPGGGAFYTPTGWRPCLGAFQSRNALPLIVSLSQLLFFDLSREFFLEILGVLSLAGLVFSLYERKTFWLVWLLAIFIFERTSPVALAVVPLAMLAGLACARLLAAGQHTWESPYQRRFVQIGFTIFVYYCVVSSYLSFSAPLLTPAVRQSMEWTAQNSAPQ